MALGFIFPGQGSQSIGMLKDLAEAHSEVGQTYAEASDALGYDLWQIVQNGPQEKLNSTDVTQPAMLAAGVAVWRVWQAQGGQQPEIMAGHSLGEYSALVCAGSLAFTDAIKLVAERGRLMQQAVPEGSGAMAAILGLDDAQVISVCESAAQGDVVEAVNFNSPGQVVVAGAKAAVERAAEAAKEAGAKRAVILPVSVPSHCSLMKPAADKLAEVLAGLDIQTPEIQVINNVDVASATDADAIRDALTRQLYQPVRWVETINKLSEQGIDTVVEAGPGKVLAGLNKRIVKTMNALPVYDSESLVKAVSA
ncbi:MAG: ACP S-malonyltransferase [Gammaproteobacteria bacterium]|nr:ACP S-malonyltransferase [Gammaproteobacteria bacterium]MDH5776944.1 ACP S-malonyltransferase [Gammaproteobacteria bacterium]